MTWKWRQASYRGAPYESHHVNMLAAQVARRYKKPHRFICITDDPRGLDSSITALPLWDTFADLPNPTYGRGPSCYRRLRIFSREMTELVGPRLVSLDLDVLLLGDVTPLWDSPWDFVIWGGPLTPRIGRAAGYWYNCSMFLMDAGCRSQVWEDFDPATSPAAAVAAGHRGSDQGWVLHKLGWGERTWSAMDGVISWRRHVVPNRLRVTPGTRVVIFNGRIKPWDRDVMPLDWVRGAYAE